MKENLNRRETRFLDAYLQGKTLAECALYAGLRGKDNNSLKVSGYRLLTKINISLPELHEMQGITTEYLRKKLEEGLDANKRFYASYQGTISSSEPFGDQPVRLKALEIAHKLRGDFVEKLELTGRSGGDLTIQLTPSVKVKKKKEIEL
jgi:phage terminase small subunit